MLSNALNRIALTSQYGRYLENAPMEVWDCEEGGEGRDPTKQKTKAARGRLQASAECV